MNFSKAFSYIREDVRWKQKFAIAALINLSVYFFGIRSAVTAYTQSSWPMAILTLLLILAPGMMTSGYTVHIARNVREGVANPLPEWSFFDHWKQGATLFLASFAYIIPISIAIGFLLQRGLLGRGGMMIMNIGLLFLAIGLFISFLMITLNINFTRTDSLRSCFHFKGLSFIMKHRWRELFMLIGFSTVMGMVASRGFTMGGNFWIGAVISAAVGALSTFAAGHLYGQVASMVDLDKMNNPN